MACGGMAALLFISSPTYNWPVSVGLISFAAITWKLSENSDLSLSLRRKLNDSYYESMRQALVTQFPHGIAYILENVLETLEFFEITEPPWQDKFYSIQYGWPNQTVLREAIDAAHYLSGKWHKLDPAEKTMAMSTIRNMIKSEVIYLRGRMSVYDVQHPNVQYFGANVKLAESMYHRSLYIYSYTQKDYDKEPLARPLTHMPASAMPKPSAPASPLPANAKKPSYTLEMFISENRTLQYYSREQQIVEYNKYLNSAGISISDHQEISEDVW